MIEIFVFLGRSHVTQVYQLYSYEQLNFTGSGPGFTDVLGVGRTSTNDISLKYLGRLSTISQRYCMNT